MVAAVRRGQSLRVVARRFGVGVATVAHWVERAKGQRLDRIDWSDRSHAPHQPRRTDTALEDLVLKTRTPWPSATWEPSAPPPSATLSGSRASRRRPRFGPSTASSLAVRAGRPPPHAPAAAAPRLVSARGRRGPGAVGQLRHRRGTGHPRRPPGRGAQRGVLARRIGCLLADGVAGHGGHDRAIARGALARSRLARLRPVRQRHDLPGHASLRGCPGTDHPLVPELRSGAGVRPAARNRLPGHDRELQRLVASQGLVRFHHANVADVQGHSQKYVQALRKQRAARIEAAPSRRPFPEAWKLDLKKRPRGRLIYLRRSNGSSAVTLLGRTWPLGQLWPNRLVRCEVDLDHDKLRFFTLRRKEPTSQPQILEVDYRLPARGFQD